MSLARRHQARIHAASIAAAMPNAPAPTPALTERAALLQQLGEDLRTLSEIQSVERKIEAKRTMVARYADWCAGAISAAPAQPGEQDDLLTTVMIWLIDIGDWPRALAIAAYVLTHGIALPERYKRTPGTLVAEEVAAASLADVEAVDFPTLAAAALLTDSHDMPDQVRAKLAKAAGRRLHHDAAHFDSEAPDAVAGGKAALLDAAIAAMRRALKLDEKCGVKKDIETIEREIRNLAPAT